VSWRRKGIQVARISHVSGRWVGLAQASSRGDARLRRLGCGLFDN